MPVKQLPRTDPGFNAEVDRVHAAFVASLQSLYNQYRASTNPDFLKNHEILAEILRWADEEKDKLRSGDINLERKLWKWGYIDRPLNEFLQGEIAVLQSRQRGTTFNRLAIEELAGVTP